MRHSFSISLQAVAVMCLALTAHRPLRGATQLVDINPSTSSLASSDADGASGGRINGLARANPTTYYAASEWGGLFKSTDAGNTWRRLDGHLPTAMWDVRVSPTDPNRVIATSFYDGKVASNSGINVSTDGGATWTHPATATPPANVCADAARREEPSAFGISFDPANSQRVYVGTNCGLAISADAGTTWRFVDPTPADAADDVWDVTVHDGGVIDTCGDDGHRRSTNGGATWTTAAGAGLPSGRCSIAASPVESYVLYAVSGTSIFETDDGGAHWDKHFANPNSQGRVPFVATNKRSATAFDLWFGDVDLWRATCAAPSPPAQGGAARCPPSSSWSGPYTRNAGGHDDVGDIAFASDGGCPTLFSSDGGVFVNTKTTSPACHTPAWRQPATTPHGLWLFGMGGAQRAGHVSDDIYFGAQDNGAFASTDDGKTWHNADCCDSFDAVASVDRVLYTSCCYRPPPATRIMMRNPGMVGGAELTTLPPGDIPGWLALDAVDQFGPKAYVVATSQGVYIANDITASTITWTPLGAASAPAGACSVRASGPPTTPTFIVEAGSCAGGQRQAGQTLAPDTLWQYAGTAPGGAWRRIQPPGNTGGFGIFTVDRSDPRRLAAAHLRATGPAMVFSADGGATWTPNAALDQAMTGNGAYRAQTRRGPIDFTMFGVYPQPTLIAFDPVDANTLVAGAANAGMYISQDRGATWTAITNNAGGSNPILPRPSFAYFSRRAAAATIYIGTEGRGIWRYEYAVAGPHPTSTGGPGARKD